MDVIERHYYEYDHRVALIIDRQLSIAPRGVTAQQVIDLNQFCDCCDDDEGYSIPKERMRALRDAGLVTGGRFGWYELTDAGRKIRDSAFDFPRPNAGANRRA
jgi:hypothetical protein